MAQGFAKAGAVHDEAHSVTSHNDTTATGAELETLTDGSDADALHTHSADGIDTSAIHDNQSAEISVITEKGSPVNADLLLIEDSASSNVKKRVQIGNLPDVGTDLTTKGDLHGYDTGQARIPVGTNNYRLVADSAQGLGVKWAVETEFIVFGENGDLEVKTGTHRFYLPYNVTIVEVEISVGTAPTGAAAIVDVNVNGTTIFTTQTNRPEIAISGFVDSSTTIEDDAHTDGQYLTVDIDQIGSTVAGADLTVVIRYEKT